MVEVVDPAVVSAVDRPVNVLAPFFPSATVADFAQAGVRRVSIGGALANTAIGTVLTAARELLEDGGFGWLGGMAPRGELQRLLGNS